MNAFEMQEMSEGEKKFSNTHWPNSVTKLHKLHNPIGGKAQRQP